MAHKRSTSPPPPSPVSSVPEPEPEPEVEPAPVLLPTFENLPDIAHKTLATMLPDGDTREQNRLCLSRLSHTLLGLHGDTLKTLDVGWDSPHDTDDTESLMNLVTRQHSLQKIYFSGRAATIPRAAAILVEQRHLRNIRELRISCQKEWQVHDVKHLADTFQVPGALQGLEVLSLSDLVPGVSGAFARALASDGTAPSLRELLLLGCRDCDADICNQDDQEALADMFERRTERQDCRGLETFEAKESFRFFDETTCRYVRAVLMSSVTTLRGLKWNSAFEVCFNVQEAMPLTLETVDMCYFDFYDLPSVQVWEAMSELQVLDLEVMGEDEGSENMLENVITALHGSVAFQNLREISLEGRNNALPWIRVLDALAGSTCATQLTLLEIRSDTFDGASVESLSAHLGKDAFPNLLSLKFESRDYSVDHFDILAQGLLASSRTRLTQLDVSEFVMGDKGMAALGNVIGAGRFDGLESLRIRDAMKWSDETALGLARALDHAGERGMPVLTDFSVSLFKMTSLTASDVEVLVCALLKNCPQLKTVHLDRCHPGGLETIHAIVKEMVRAAGRMHRLTFDVIDGMHEKLRHEECMRICREHFEMANNGNVDSDGEDDGHEFIFDDSDDEEDDGHEFMLDSDEEDDSDDEEDDDGLEIGV